jgi:hypothetical protein
MALRPGGPIRSSPVHRLLAPTRGNIAAWHDLHRLQNRAIPHLVCSNIPEVELSKIDFGTLLIGSRVPKSLLEIGHSVMSVWTVRKGGLSTSLPRCVHPPPIKPVFYGRPRRLVSTRVSRLNTFSVYPLQRGCPAMPYRTTGKLVAARPCSSRTRGPFVSGDCDPRS